MNRVEEIILPDTPPPMGPPPLPPPRPWNGWMTLVWLVAVMGMWMTVQTVFLFIFLPFEGAYADMKVFQEKVEAVALDGDFLGLATVLTAVVVCPLCFFIGKFRRGFTGWKYMALGRPRIVDVILWVILVIGTGFLFNVAAPAMGIEETPEFMFDIVKSTNIAIFLVLGVAVAAPFVEEFVFRGLIFRGWRASRIGLWPTILLTSLLWSLLHFAQYDLAVLSYIFILGILLGYARERTGNLWVPISMHAANNALALVGTLGMLE